MTCITDAGNFINWYRIQNFPEFPDKTLQSASFLLEVGYKKAQEQLRARQGEEMRYTLAMLSILKQMEECKLELDTACFILVHLNSIAKTDELCD